MYHGAVNRGAAPLNLLSGVTNPPVKTGQESIRSFILGVENVRISVDQIHIVHGLPFMEFIVWV